MIMDGIEEKIKEIDGHLISLLVSMNKGFENVNNSLKEVKE